MSDKQGVVIQDVEGEPLGTVANPLITSSGGVGPAATVNQGLDGTAPEAWWVKPTADGATVSLPLPQGAATEPKQDAGNASLATIASSLDTQLSTRASEATLAGIAADVDVALSSRAAEATQQAVLGQLDAKTSTLATEATLSAGLTAANASLDAIEASAASIDAKLTPPLAVAGPLTDAELRASSVPVSGPVTDAQLRAAPVPVSGPLTDAQLRAAPVPVSGTVTANVGTTNGLALDATLTNGNQLAQVHGRAAVGAPITGNPVPIAGRDATSNLRIPRVDANGLQWQALSSPNLINNAVGQPPEAFVHAAGGLVVATPPSTLFIDRFDGVAFDTVRWAVSTGGTGAASVATGNATLATGTTASNFAAIQSLPTFTPLANVFLTFATTVRFDNGSFGNNTHRFLGIGTAGANTTANPLTDAVGFEVDTSGSLNAVVYAAGMKVFSQTITTPTNLQRFHRYFFIYSSSTIAWYVDTSEVASVYAVGRNFATPILPATQTLPIRFHLINGATPPSNAPVFVIASAATGDDGHNNTSISDGTYPFRRLAIAADGSITANTTEAAVTSAAGVSLANVNTTTQMFAALASRKGLSVDNTFGSATVFVNLGAAATTSPGGYVKAVLPGTTWEMPWRFTGVVNYICSAAGGTASSVAQWS